MSGITTQLPSARHRPWAGAAAALRTKDPEFLAVKRSVRAALAMPAVFAFCYVAFSDPQVSLFGAFGSFALLLFVEFPGRPRARLVSYTVLWVAGGCLITLGTVVSTHPVAAVVGMAVVGLVVLFAGIMAPPVAAASTAALLTFVLPVAVAQPASAVGPRLVGWALAGAVCVPACMVLWPAPWHDDLRRRLSAALSAVGRRPSAVGRLVASYVEGKADPAASADVVSELTRLRDHFAGTPYPPTGGISGAVALAKMVGRVEWVAGNARLIGDGTPGTSPSGQVLEAVAETIRRTAALICDENARPVDDPRLVEAVQDATSRLDRLMSVALDVDVSALIDPDRTAVWAWATNRRHASWRAGSPRICPFAPCGSATPRRAAVGLAAAVGVVEVTDVQHGFWVVLGTLSVLRSNALGTGATALRAVGGTAVGFLAGSAIMVGVADHTALLWVLLPLAVLVSGVAPSMISFAAGQAGFTLMVIILFNIIDPQGWKVGLTRIEDVAIGCGVSIVVGLLFWPRGATAALGRALARAFVTSSGYLADAVDRLTITSRPVDTGPGQQASHRAYLLLDDAFRQYLAEGGAKVVPIETVARLFTGSNRLRLAAFTLSTLEVAPDDLHRPELESVAIAGAVRRDSYAASHRWYEEFAEVLADQRAALDPPPPHDTTLHDVLRRAFDDARSQRREDRLRATLRMLWADELLESQNQVQADLAASADRFARQRHVGRLI